MCVRVCACLVVMVVWQRQAKGYFLNSEWNKGSKCVCVYVYVCARGVFVCLFMCVCVCVVVVVVVCQRRKGA